MVCIYEWGHLKIVSGWSFCSHLQRWLSSNLSRRNWNGPRIAHKIDSTCKQDPGKQTHVWSVNKLYSKWGQGSSLVDTRFWFKETAVEIQVGEKNYPLSFLSYVLMISIYPGIYSWSCKAINSWINSSCRAFQKDWII